MMDVDMDIDIEIDHEEYELWIRLSRTAYKMRRVRAAELRRANISGIQAIVLLIIKSAIIPVTVGRLSRVISRERHTITGLMIRMVKQGLVKRIKGKNNQVSFELEEKGEEAVKLARQMASIHKIISSISDEEQNQLRLILDKLMSTTLSEASAWTELSLT